MVNSFNFIIFNLFSLVFATPRYAAQPAPLNKKDVFPRATVAVPVRMDHTPDAMITQAPLPSNILKRDGGNFVGYYLSNGSYHEWYCADGKGTWTAAGGLGGCCHYSSCNDYVTGCDGSIVSYLSGATSTCSESKTCQTQSVFSTYGALNYVPWIGCGNNGDYNIYRSMPSSIEPEPFTRTVTQTEALRTVTTTASPSQHTNNAAIIGGVVGGLCLFGILAFVGVCCFMRRRNKKSSNTRPSPPEQISSSITSDPESKNTLPAELYNSNFTLTTSVPFPTQAHKPSQSSDEINVIGSPAPPPYSSIKN